MARRSSFLKTMSGPTGTLPGQSIRLGPFRNIESSSLFPASLIAHSAGSNFLSSRFLMI